MKHADVKEALDLAEGEVGEESKRICRMGGAALSEGHIAPAKAAIAYSEKLAVLAKKIAALRGEWEALQSEIDSATPEVQRIIRPELPLATPDAVKSRKPAKEHKTGYTRTVESVGPKTNFRVTFPDGTVVSDAVALRVLVKAIEKIGAEKVASVGLLIGGEPLVSKNKKDFKKYPQAIAPCANGWFVHTHSNTKRKMTCVQKIAAALKIPVKIVGA
jgi:hypothetical protein